MVTDHEILFKYKYMFNDLERDFRTPSKTLQIYKEKNSDNFLISIHDI